MLLAVTTPPVGEGMAAVELAPCAKAMSRKPRAPALDIPARILHVRPSQHPAAARHLVRIRFAAELAQDKRFAAAALDAIYDRYRALRHNLAKLARPYPADTHLVLQEIVRGIQRTEADPAAGVSRHRPAVGMPVATGDEHITPNALHDTLLRLQRGNIHTAAHRCAADIESAQSGLR